MLYSHICKEKLEQNEKNKYKINNKTVKRIIVMEINSVQNQNLSSFKNGNTVKCVHLLSSIISYICSWICCRGFITDCGICPSVAVL